MRKNINAIYSKHQNTTDMLEYQADTRLAYKIKCVNNLWCINITEAVNLTAGQDKLV